MAWKELDALTDEQLLHAIHELRYSLWEIDQEEPDEDGWPNLANTYLGYDLSKRLDLLVDEAERRGLTVPEEEE